MTIKAVAMSRPVQAEEWAMRQASSIVGKHFPDMPIEKQWEVSADIAEAFQMVRMMFDPTSYPLPAETPARS
jgi:hypothetical protein